jgi:two-component system nitrogen regulation sensor histidine kinase GlnL
MDAVLDALPHPVLVVDGANQIRYANAAAEGFFAQSAAALRRARLDAILPFASPLLSLVAQTREREAGFAEYGMELGLPRARARMVTLRTAPVPEAQGAVVIMIEEQSIAAAMDRQLTHRGALRSVTGMAAMLAHEIRNPLSGIRGAAQLLEAGADEADRPLARLICAEADRICGIVARVEMFGEETPLVRAPVNIHEVLEHVRRLAEAGFAAHIRFTESYDPSLPPVPGDRDQLVQVFLNLIKNAAEATPDEGGEITLSTAYCPGVRLSVPGSAERLQLPLEVCVCDNGAGVRDDLRPHLFDPFVTTKPRGDGLGLALVAKIVGEHGGVVECLAPERGAMFRVLLPIAPGAGGSSPPDLSQPSPYQR